MPQAPTPTTRHVVNDFQGLHDQRDSLTRPQGTVTNQRNLWDSQIGDANRRKGRTLNHSEAGSVNSIFAFDWGDGGVVNIYNSVGNRLMDAITFPSQGTTTGWNVNPTTPQANPSNGAIVTGHGCYEIPKYTQIAWPSGLVGTTVVARYFGAYNLGCSFGAFIEVSNNVTGTGFSIVVGHKGFPIPCSGSNDTATNSGTISIAGSLDPVPDSYGPKATYAFKITNNLTSLNIYNNIGRTVDANTGKVIIASTPIFDSNIPIDNVYPGTTKDTTGVTGWTDANGNSRTNGIMYSIDQHLYVVTTTEICY